MYKDGIPKIRNVLGKTIETVGEGVPIFTTKNWEEVHDQSGDANYRYKPIKHIRFNTSMLQSDLCDYSDTHIVFKGTTTFAVLAEPNSHAYDKKLAFKNNAQFINYMSKINCDAYVQSD